MLATEVIASGLMSWQGLYELGVMAGMGWTARLLPISIDGMLLLGSLYSLHATLGNRKARMGLLMTFVGVGLSIAGNMLGSWERGILASSVHAIPPLMLFFSLCGFELIMKHRITAENAEKRKAVKRSQKRSKTETAQMPVVAKKFAQRATQSLPEGNPRVLPTLDDAELVSIQEMLPEEGSKADKIRVILRQMPDATPSVVARILGEESPKTIANTVHRLRKELADASEEVAEAV